VFYLWNITVNGMGNQFYAAAAWAGSRDWKALLFGSLDPGNFITVDKPPLSQWVMGLSGQLFGFGSASMLVPEALMGVAAVALVYATTTRLSGSRRAGLLAGLGLALMPVAALMFRFNNPDAAMVLLMTLAAYGTVRAIDARVSARASVGWIALAGVALGFAFLAKMLEGLMVMPALAVAYLLAAPTGLRTRLIGLVSGLAALVVSSGWYVLLTLWWPASSRPYLAGSTDDNFMNLVLGYNGFGRVLGHNHHGGGAAAGPAGAPTPAAADWTTHSGGRGFGGFGGQTRGLARLFSGEFGFEIGWLLPAALLAFVLVLASRWRAPRTDAMRAGAIVFGGWIVVDGAVLSYMSGMVHPYYCLSLAPAVAGMFALGVWEMWRGRSAFPYRAGLAALIALTGVWSFVLLDRNASWAPALRVAVLVVTLLAAITLVLARTRERVLAAAVALGVAGALAGSAGYAVATVATAHSGGGPTVGPAVHSTDGHRGFGGFGQSQANPQLAELLSATDTHWSAAVSRSSTAAGLELASGTSVMAIGGFTGSDPTPTLAQFQQYVRDHQIGYFVVMGGGRGGWGGRDQHADITAWVKANFTPMQVGAATVYRLQ
jgi:4-amino-4-deoxy-L-arabinose transferase-like glycosyltransferase